MSTVPPPSRGARFTDFQAFWYAIELHAGTSQPRFDIARKGDYRFDPPGEAFAKVGCAHSDVCGFAVSAAAQRFEGNPWIVYATNYRHTCGLPSPFASGQNTPNMSRTPASSPTQPMRASLGSPTQHGDGAAPTSSALAAHWSWLSFGKGIGGSPPGRTHPTFPSFKKIRADEEHHLGGLQISAQPVVGNSRELLQPGLAVIPSSPKKPIMLSSDEEGDRKPAVAPSHHVPTLALPDVAPPHRDVSSEPETEWPPTNVKFTVPAPQIGDMFPSRDTARDALDKAGAAAQPRFTVYTARSTNAPADRAFIIWHCQHRQRNGSGCSFFMRAVSQDSTLTKWCALSHNLQRVVAEHAHRQIVQAHYEHSNHPPPGWKPQRKKPSQGLMPLRGDTPGLGDTSDASDAAIGRNGRRRPAPKDRPTPEYAPPPRKQQRKAPGGAGDGPGGFDPPEMPEPLGPLGPFLAGLHPMLGGCGTALVEAGIHDVSLLLSLEDGEVREVLKAIDNLKPFHRAAIAHRVAQVKAGSRDNPLVEKSPESAVLSVPPA